MRKIKKPRIADRTPLDENEYKAFLKFLPPNIRIVVETYKFAANIYAEIGCAYNWSELFQLDADVAFGFSSPVPIIRVERSSRYRTAGEDFFSHFIPEHLVDRIFKLVQKKRGSFLFQQENGSPFDYKRITNEFRKASRKALKAGKIKHPIIPSDLRSSPHRNVSVKNGVNLQISEEKIKAVKSILPHSRRNAGAPSRYDLKEILSVLLIQEATGYSRSEMQKKYQSFRAAESQRQRWIKKGIWKRILQIFEV